MSEMTLAGLDAITGKTETKPAQNVIGFAPPESQAKTFGPPALRPFRPDDRVLKSELPGVPDDAWTDFVLAMKVGKLDSVSPSNGVGMFDQRYKRLAEMGLVTNVRYKRDPITNRSVQMADWVSPLSAEQFLKSAKAQYRVFASSMQHYYGEILEGKLKLPPGVSPSGALAILHRGGRAALEKWKTQQFPQTKELFERVNWVF